MPKYLMQVAKANKRYAEVFIYGDIGGFFGEGVTAAGFAKDLKALGDVSEINVRINSVGGSPFDGLAIYNSLARHPAKVIVDVDGVALSAASIIAMAGDTIRMAESAAMMIHEASAPVYGRASAHRKTADALDMMNENMAALYSARSGVPAARVREMLDAETWFDAKLAVKEGFADEIGEPLKMAAMWIPSGRFQNVPDRFAASMALDAPSESDIEQDMYRVRIASMQRKVSALAQAGAR